MSKTTTSLSDWEELADRLLAYMQAAFIEACVMNDNSNEATELWQKSRSRISYERSRGWLDKMKGK